MKPKVSVIIATHNHAATIGDCIDSIWSRSFTGVEVIVVDVNSTDSTKEMLLEMAEDDAQVTFLADGMGSLGHARNMGMNHARAPYIMFLEPEDVLHKHINSNQTLPFSLCWKMVWYLVKVKQETSYGYPDHRKTPGCA